jgi:hypothetical protein
MNMMYNKGSVGPRRARKTRPTVASAEGNLREEMKTDEW